MIRFAIVTPSLNQGAYLAQGAESVLNQRGSFFLDYHVADGGSDDGTLEILRDLTEKYADAPGVRFGYESRPDAGQYQAVNHGFARVSGEVMAWLNADDAYLPGALAVAAEIFESLPEVRWLTSACPMTLDAQGRLVGADRRFGYGPRAFARGLHLPGGSWRAKYFIQQDCTFWRRSLWDEAGGELREEVDLAGDFELWSRFFKLAPLYAVNAPLGAFRIHTAQRTVDHDAYVAQAATLLWDGAPPPGRGAVGRMADLACRNPSLGRFLARLGLAEAAPLIKHAGREGGWRVHTRYLA